MNPLTPMYSESGYAAGFWLILAGLLAWTAAPPAVAQVGADEGWIEEILVTARKREESLQETPISITAFTTESMSDANMVDLRDIGKYTPGMSFTSYGMGSSEAGAMFLRGIGQSDHMVTTDPGVGLYIDGVYVGRNQGAALDLLDLEQVEVLRGPQGTLFGKNTIGGAVNVTTRKPGDETGGRVSLTVGEDGRLNGTASVELPLGSRTAFAASILRKTRDGVGRQIFTDEETGDEDSVSGRAQLYWSDDSTTELSVTVDFLRARQAGMPHSFYEQASFLEVFPCYMRDGDGYASCGPGVEGDPFDSYSLDDLDTEQDLFGIAANFERAITDTLTFKSITAYRDMEYLGNLEFDGAPQRIVYYHELGGSDQFSQEFQLSGTDREGALNWIAGLYYFTEDGDNDQFNYEFGGATNRHTQVETSSYAVFGQTTADISERLSLTAGLRYTEEEKDYDLNYPNLGEGGEPATTDAGNIDYVVPPTRLNDTWDAVSGTVNLSFQATEDVMAYATYSRGFRSGGYAARPSRASSVGAYDPEYVDMYEMGVKTLLLDERLRINLAIYRNDYEDYQAQVNSVGDAFDTRVVNAAEAKIDGAELEATLFFTPTFRIEATYGYTDAKIEKVDLDPSLEANFTKGSILPYVSKYTFSLSPQLRIPLSGGANLTGRLDYAYRDDFYGQISNSPFEKEDGYGLLNLRVAYQNAARNWTLALYGINVTDEEYTRVRNYFPGFIGFAIWNTDRKEFGVEASYEF